MTVYLSNYVGVWGEASDSERLLKRVSEPVNLMIKSMSSTEALSWHADDIFNRSVKKSFNFIGHLPEHISDAIDGAKVACTIMSKEAKLANQEMASIFRNLSHVEMMRFLEMLELRPISKDSLYSEGSIKKAEEKQRLEADEEATAGLKQQAKDEAEAEAGAEEAKQ
ncbi:uncharacterized protein LOC111066367 [Drosophila obscura]|uniref:uncharacterized protein LOC111066367 n=1 Tax=Drosophila obscura TaxID=7282 RepID=UPI001BB2766C|nr:uncharacterized protein LOC111066367 [Drosophila obscura]